MPYVEHLCHRCEKPLPTPFVIDANDNDLCAECAAPPAPLCALGCGENCPPDDRLPWMVSDTERGYVHLNCVSKLQNAMGFQRAAILIRRSGPAFKGRS